MRARVGLVLAGGGIAGYGFHTGALSALADTTGWSPSSAEVIVGTSSGSIVASLLRAGIGPAELKERILEQGPESETDAVLSALVGSKAFEWPAPRWGAGAVSLFTSEIARSWRRGGVRPAHLLAGVLPVGRVSTKPLGDLIAPLHPDGWPEEALWIPVTDDRTGERVVFGRPEQGRSEVDWPDVATAVRASCAIPGYFEPVTHGGRRYIDGGIGAADNADLLVGHGLDVVVICSPLSMDGVDLPFAPVTSALRAYPRHRLGSSVQALTEDGLEVLVLEPDRSLSVAMGWTAMATRRLRPVVEASERHVFDELSAKPQTPALRALSA